MKVLLAVDCYPDTINGVASSVLTLKKALEHRGHQVKLLTLNRSIHSEKIGTDLYALGSLSAKNIYPDARLSFRMNSKLIDELILWHPDVIHTNNEFTTYLISVRIARECNVPLIHTYHTVYEDYTHYFSPNEKIGKHMVKDLSRSVTKFADHLIVPTPKIKDLLISYEIIKGISVIPTGIDLSKFSEKPDDAWIQQKRCEYHLDGKQVAVFIGRVAKEKNIEELIRVFKSFSDEKVLLIVGNGPDRETLEDLSEGHENIIFTGMVDRSDVQNYYHLGDIFCSASTSETQGLTYYEAMAASLPLVCRKDDCLEDILKNGENGYQVETTEEFKEKIEFLLTHPEIRREMAKKSFDIADKYSVSHFGEAVEAVYKEAISNNYEKQDVASFFTDMNQDVMEAYHKIRTVFSRSIYLVDETEDMYLISEEEHKLILFWKDKHLSEHHKESPDEELFETVFYKQNGESKAKCICKKCMLKAVQETNGAITYEETLKEVYDGILNFR